MAYARVENGEVLEYPLYEGDIKLRFPHVSFPRNFTPPPGYELVEDAIRPVVDEFKLVKEGRPIHHNGKLIQSWIVEDIDEEALAEKTQMEAIKVRDRRNQLLQMSDWTQLADAEVDAEAWRFYRQQLRNITTQDSFPWEVEWPVSPDGLTFN